MDDEYKETNHDPSREVSESWHTYPQIFALGHKALESLLKDPVLIEEKVDGSQFSFGIFKGELRCRSKGCNIFLDAPTSMFIPAVEYVKSVSNLLCDGWTYRAEFVGKPKHNVLAYDRIPKNGIIIFDINSAHEEYLSYDEKVQEAARLDLETVPRLYEGMLDGYQRFQMLLETVSVLGGQKVEGVVVKNYTRFGRDKKVLMGKFVSEFFKEVHQAEWKTQNTNHNDILLRMEMKYKTPARWAKAVQHLHEAGVLEQSPRDIGLLIKEVGNDIFKECESEIMAELKEWAMPQIRRLVIRGLPEWYKEELAKAQFDVKEAL